MPWSWTWFGVKFTWPPEGLRSPGPPAIFMAIWITGAVLLHEHGTAAEALASGAVIGGLTGLLGCLVRATYRLLARGRARSGTPPEY